MWAVRVMTMADIEAVYALECNCFSVPWSKDSLEKEIANKLAYYVVLEEHEKIIGYGGLWGILGEGEITNIAVDTAYRGKGYGSVIVRELIKYGEKEDFERITLEVRQSNVIAQKLYMKSGFKEIAVRKNYYQKPTEDAIIMAWHK